MAARKRGKSPKKGSQQTFASRRTVNPTGRGRGSQPINPNAGASFHEHDPRRRLGSFEGAGEHARTGNRGRQ
jgi:hypothetical protein